MAQLKIGDTEAFMKKPDLSRQMLLVYGADTGLVSERATALAALHLSGNDDPFAHVRVDGDTLAADPARLASEAYSIGLFGGRRVIQIRAGGKSFADSLLPLFASPPPDTTIIIEAGNLKAGHALRKAFEEHAGALAIPCISDEPKLIVRLVETEVQKHGFRIEPDAKQLLCLHLGGDRLASKQELNKLFLYCHGCESISLDDVRQSIGDVSAIAVEEVLDAMGLGDLPKVVSGVNRLLKEGGQPSMIAGYALRHMNQLQLARSAVDKGRTTADAMRTLAPPVFYKRAPGFERQIVLWSLEKSEQASNAFAKAQEETRKNAALAPVILERALVAATLLARSGK